MAFSDPALEVRQCHFHCILWVTTESLKSAQIQGAGRETLLFKGKNVEEFSDVLEIRHSPLHICWMDRYVDGC